MVSLIYNIAGSVLGFPQRLQFAFLDTVVHNPVPISIRGFEIIYI